MNRNAHALSRTLLRAVEDLRVEFTPYVDAFGRLARTRAEIAVKFMATFRSYHRETGHTFVAFVHELDHTVPATRDDYVNHRSYQAALYLRRIEEKPETRAGKRTSRSPFDVLASCIRGLLPTVAPYEEAYWASLRRLSGWRDRDVARLRERVASARPLPLPMAPRLVRHASARPHLHVAADRQPHHAGM